MTLLGAFGAFPLSYKQVMRLVMNNIALVAITTVLRSQKFISEQLRIQLFIPLRIASSPHWLYLQRVLALYKFLKTQSTLLSVQQSFNSSYRLSLLPDSFSSLQNTSSDELTRVLRLPC